MSADELCSRSTTKYADSFAHKGKPVVKVGLNFLPRGRGVSSLEWEME